jgi:hypothetical protein
MSRPRTKPEKPKNKAVVVCTDNNRTVKGVIVVRNDSKLVVDLPTGFQMHLDRNRSGKLYVFRVGTLEFISDGYPVS